MNAKLFVAAVVVLSGLLLSGSDCSVAVKAQDASGSDSLKQAQVEYAQAMVKVAQADLAKAREINSKAPDTIPAAAVRNLENDVAMSQGRVRTMQSGDGGEKESPYVIAAKNSLGFTEESLKEAQQINARAAGAISKSEVDRRQADVDLSRARLHVAQLLDSASPTERMQWELLQLQEELHGLQFTVRLLQYRN